MTRKITLGLSRIKFGFQKILYLGNLDARRDWGYAKDYVKAMWKILQHDKAGDFVIATGETHSVREFVEEAARHLGMEIKWKGKGIDEKGVDHKTGKIIVGINPLYFRPKEVHNLVGDASKARKVLGWQPKLKFKDLVEMMIKHDLDYVQRDSRGNIDASYKKFVVD